MSKTQYEVSAATHQWVRGITPGTPVDTVLVVESASLKEARNGPFWMLDLKDATGSLSARVWSPLSQMFTDIPVGSLVAVEGRSERYREQIQCSVTALRVLDEDETAGVDASIFMPASARSPLIMLEELEAMADAVFVHEPWKLFIRRVLRDEDVRPRLLKASAARGIHHARVGGLLEHTLGVARLCLHFVELYPQLDRQALLAGAICHDLGKLWELTTGLTTDYTDEGRLAGHIFLGLERLRPHMEAAGLEEPLRLHLQHLVLSHHGQYEYGSPRLPQTAEALALHYADNVDAKMDQCRSLFGDMEPQDAAWSPFQRSLERAMYRAPRTPEGVVPDEQAEPLDVSEPDPQADREENTEDYTVQDADFPQDDVPEAYLENLPDELSAGVLVDLDDLPDDLPADLAGAPDLDMPAYLDDAPGPEEFPECLPDMIPDEAAGMTVSTEAVAPMPNLTVTPDTPVAAKTPAESRKTVDPDGAGDEAETEEHPKTKKPRLEARQCSLL